MADKKTTKIAAVIDIGSNRVKMHISQLKKNTIQRIWNVWKFLFILVVRYSIPEKSATKAFWNFRVF